MNIYFRQLVTNQENVNEDFKSNSVNQQQNNEYLNPVGELLEFTQKYSIRPPVFEFGNEEGPPHNKQFICNATLGQCVEIGTGRAKKDAKRQAAIKLLTKIKSNTLNMSSFGIDTSSNRNDSNKNDLNSNNGFFHQLNKDKRNHKTIQNSFSIFKHSDKPLIKELLSNQNILTNDEISDSNCKYLEDLSKELNFEYFYYQIPVISKSGNFLIKQNLSF
jgi:RISC-loading complex subunit TARBP2